MVKTRRSINVSATFKDKLIFYKIENKYKNIEDILQEAFKLLKERNYFNKRYHSARIDSRRIRRIFKKNDNKRTKTNN